MPWYKCFTKTFWFRLLSTPPSTQLPARNLPCLGWTWRVCLLCHTALPASFGGGGAAGRVVTFFLLAWAGSSMGGVGGWFGVAGGQKEQDFATIAPPIFITSDAHTQRRLQLSCIMWLREPLPPCAIKSLFIYTWQGGRKLNLKGRGLTDLLSFRGVGDLILYQREDAALSQVMMMGRSVCSAINSRTKKEEEKLPPERKVRKKQRVMMVKGSD